MKTTQSNNQTMNNTTDLLCENTASEELTRQLKEKNPHDQLTAAAGEIAIATFRQWQGTLQLTTEQEDKLCFYMAQVISTNPTLVAMAVSASEKEQEMLRLKAVETILDEDNWQEFASKVEQCPSVQSAIRVRKELKETKITLGNVNKGESHLMQLIDQRDTLQTKCTELQEKVMELEDKLQSALRREQDQIILRGVNIDQSKRLTARIVELEKVLTIISQFGQMSAEANLAKEALNPTTKP